MKQVAFPIISVLLGCVFAILIAEGALRILGIGYGIEPLESDPILHHVHPKKYKFLMYDPGNEFGGFHVYYDKDGRIVSAAEWNAPPKSDGKGNSSCRIAFLGDSFTEAAEVPYEKSFVGLLKSMTVCQVHNYGVMSYSPMVYLTQWRQMIRETRPSLVVVQLYSNDISGDKNYAELAKFDSDGLPVAIPNATNDGLVRFLRNFYLARLVRKVQLKTMWWLAQDAEAVTVVGGYVEENPEITTLSSRLMETLAREVRNSGATFVMFVVPSKYRLFNPKSQWSESEFSDRWKIWNSKNKLGTFVDLVPQFRRCSEQGVRGFFQKDIHFNATGHKIVADTICRQLVGRRSWFKRCEVDASPSCLSPR